MSSVEVRAGRLKVLMMEVTVRWTKLRGRQSFTMSSVEAGAGTLRVLMMEETGQMDKVARPAIVYNE